MQPFAQGTYDGEEKLVIGIDIGTTFSAVSYTHRYAGGPQVITRVGKWAGQPEQRTISKIPTVVYYNDREEAVLCGAEAMTLDAQDEAEENGWLLAKHFKLHLHPEHLRTEHKLKMEDLPHGLSIERIYGDFLRYLITHTQKFFEERTANGERIWSRLINSADIVIAHPNGWGLREQSALRRAAIQAEVASEGDAGTRIRFVSEGEASVHYCLIHGNIASKLQRGTKFLVCDAGGSTVDTTAYVVKKREPSLTLEEAKASGCVQAGGIYVNQEAAWALRAAFGECQIQRDVMEEWLRNATNDFEATIKREFPRTSGRYSLAIDRASYHNKLLGVKNGRIMLNHEYIASLFEPCVDQIKHTVRHQLRDFDAEHILLVGGFGESPYLQIQLRDEFKSPRLDITVVEDGASKAVADGAVIWNCTRQVDARVARYSYGTTVHALYDSMNPEHANRPTYVRADGTTRVRNCWRDLVLQGALLDDDTSQSIFYDFPSREAAKDGLKTLRQFIYSHPGYPESKSFVRDAEGNLNPGFEKVCEITADLTSLVDSLEPIDGEHGTYYKVYFKIRMTFGDTELKAYLEWDEKGVKRQGPAKVIPNYLE